MEQDITYAILLRLDEDTQRQVMAFREHWMQHQPDVLLMPPQITIKSFFRPCVPCGTLIQRLQVSLQDFPPVPLHLGEQRWLADGTLHWDGSLMSTGEQNMDLLHLKTKVWSTIMSLVSLFCEFTPGEPFSYRTNNPWQPGVPLLKQMTQYSSDLSMLPEVPAPRSASGMVMDLYRVRMNHGQPMDWEHVTAFPAAR
ncbi:hypothetical protein [Deinococcus roseus]|uniref:2'-5' RNA ligase n=1 Tax=Deinococcus roseus TaxID=392414 RepID=A0ABQ2CZ07_9DEIO|nr:hypothetical protein [Deinococcus roseus]GGJ27739.1 hypothetical protein GCM10008938_12250 [Deinococcus roseus]